MASWNFKITAWRCQIQFSIVSEAYQRHSVASRNHFYRKLAFRFKRNVNSVTFPWNFCCSQYFLIRSRSCLDSKPTDAWKNRARNKHMRIFDTVIVLGVLLYLSSHSRREVLTLEISLKTGGNTKIKKYYHLRIYLRQWNRLLHDPLHLSEMVKSWNVLRSLKLNFWKQGFGVNFFFR